MSPISTERLVKELEKLKAAMDSGTLDHGEYDQRLSRVIRELRERGVEGERADMHAAIDGALERGVITPSVKSHLLKRLGLE
jgi:hypothetical protein